MLSKSLKPNDKNRIPDFFVDFRQGNFRLKHLNEFVSLNHVTINDNFFGGEIRENKSGKWLCIEPVRFGGILLQLLVGLDSKKRTISLGPLTDASFDDCGKIARKLAEALQKISHKEFYPMLGWAEFDWGRIDVMTEWRDCGWGVVFTIDG